jgi:uncharacterized spore protein YtfJ
METTQIKQLFASLAETFSQNSTIKKVYGDPIETQGKTIIPVAKVSMGFGGGFGGGTENKNENADLETKPTGAKGEGGGMGGGLAAKPIGVIEITPNQTRFIRFNTWRYIALGAVLGMVISRLGRRARHRHHYPPL